MSHLDANNDLFVTPIDVLILINSINSDGVRNLEDRATSSTEPYYDVNGDDWLTPLDVLTVINAINRALPEPNVAVGASPKSDPNGNGVVLESEIELVGQAGPFARLTVSVVNPDSASQSVANVEADESGAFRVPVPLVRGANEMRIRATDELGRVFETSRTVRRGDVVQDWNAAALNVIRDWTTTSNDPYQGRIVTAQPPMVARNLAMIHAAIFDAVNAVDQLYESYATALPKQTGASPVAAAASAAYRVASTLYTDADELSVWDASLAEALATIPDDASRAAGIALGNQVGAAILALRANDGAATRVTYTPVTEPGDWNRTFPDYLPPLLPQWPQVTPFALTSANQFRPDSPPEVTSPEYTVAVDQVMELGGLTSSLRTPDQTEIALFWADGGGTATPPGHWNRIASEVLDTHPKNLVDSARTFALLNIALADAGIASWDAKYAYDLWRPVDAIRKAELDGNPGTQEDVNWLPLLKTPPFPSYTSGHSTFSGAAAEVLTRLFGDNVTFSSEADGHTGLAQRPLAEGLVTRRTFDSFQQAAEEAGMSRIYGGIHYSFDNTVGLNTGQRVGAFVNNILRRGG